MQIKVWLAPLVLLAFAAGGMTSWLFLADSDPQTAAVVEPKPRYWVAPMDPSYRRDKPGKSAMGMDLVPVYAQDSASGEAPAQGEVRISPAVENNLGVKTAAVLRSVLQDDIWTVGYVQFDEDRLHHVHLRVDGWIETLNVSAEGEQVAAGEVLFELYSPTLFNAQKDMVSALKSGERELINAARQRLRLLGLTNTQIKKLEASRVATERIAFYAPQSGIVSDLNVRHGMFVEPSREIMAIGAIDTVWVIAEVFERQSPWLEPGQGVTMSVDSFPGQQWQARVDYIYPVLNVASRTVRVRIRIDNRDRRLKPNMFASMIIHAQDAEPVLNIPRSALILSGEGQRVVTALGEGRFLSVPVNVGREAGDRVEILSGLSTGDRVVVAAQFLIDSESNINAESSRLGSTQPAVSEAGVQHDD